MGRAANANRVNHHGLFWAHSPCSILQKPSDHGTSYINSYRTGRLLPDPLCAVCFCQPNKQGDFSVTSPTVKWTSLFSITCEYTPVFKTMVVTSSFHLLTIVNTFETCLWNQIHTLNKKSTWQSIRSSFIPWNIISGTDKHPDRKQTKYTHKPQKQQQIQIQKPKTKPIPSPMSSTCNGIYWTHCF